MAVPHRRPDLEFLCDAHWRATWCCGRMAYGDRHFVYFGALLATLGVVFNRVNVVLFAMTLKGSMPQVSPETYSPTIVEWGVSIGLIAATIFLFGLGVRMMPVLPKEQTSHGHSCHDPRRLAGGASLPPASRGRACAGRSVLTQDEHRLAVVAIEGEGGLRIDYCETCRGYLKTYDGEGSESVLLADWTSIHLHDGARSWTQAAGRIALRPLSWRSDLS